MEEGCGFTESLQVNVIVELTPAAVAGGGRHMDNVRSVTWGDPHFIEAGTGPGVVCLHANAATSGQWRPLMEILASRFQILAADTLGAGRSPAWPKDRLVVLSDEVAFLEPVFVKACEPFSLVGHSYGAAVALLAALARPERVSCLVLYEPTLFSVLEEESPCQEAFLEITNVAEAAAADVEAGDLDRAGERFIDYWMGPGSWAAMPDTRKRPVAASMRNVSGWAHALIRDPSPLSAFRHVDVPVLYLVGDLSPASSRGVARLLTSVLPRVEFVELKGLGHMAPLTDPQHVNPIIDDFLTRTVSG